MHTGTCLRNCWSNQDDIVLEKVWDHPILPNPTQYSEVEWNLLKILKGHPKLSQSEMAEKLGMNVNRLKYYLNELRKAPRPAIRHVGTTRNGYWEVLVDI